MMKTSVYILLVVCLIFGSYGRLGIDIPTPAVLTVEQAKCLVKNHYEMIFIRAYRSYGSVDPNVVTNILNADQAGIKEIHVYIFPCVPCGNPRKQVRDTLDNLGRAPYEVVWVDIEEWAWTKNKTYNQWFVREMLDELKIRGRKIGVYASLYQWDKIVGREWDGAKDYLLWYPHWDHKPSFGDFKPFGGWTKPFAKQFDAHGEICGMTGLDFDYRPE